MYNISCSFSTSLIWWNFQFSAATKIRRRRTRPRHGKFHRSQQLQSAPTHTHASTIRRETGSSVNNKRNNLSHCCRSNLYRLTMVRWWKQTICFWNCEHYEGSTHSPSSCLRKAERRKTMIRLKEQRGVGTSRAMVTESHDVENWIRCEHVNEMTMAIVNGWNDIATFFPCAFRLSLAFVCIIFLDENRKKPIPIDSFVLFIFSSKNNFFPSFVCRYTCFAYAQTWSLLFRHLRGYYFNDRLWRVFQDFRVFVLCASKCGDIFCRIQRKFHRVHSLKYMLIILRLFRSPGKFENCIQLSPD